ncbi:Uma2 family endonuclease [Streptomyces sp. LHD-70]|uniref:Uma2 family endonuclease n=1 Tax=Streptomyces sp. LHD-70 TaxID=3072140 RepID=UPI0028108A58|nr:Uma2 family endonuclease [Streptomyces sp. LHD-70]MDQ8704652.1 Uma2 family endonuclease [Streptomyces sp. LHD-70]
MTVVETDRIEMAESNDERTLDEMFEWLEKMPIPEGYKTEFVGGHLFMSPQRDNHWEIIFDILDQLRTKYPRKRLKSDVRIDYPGYLNGFATDVTLLKADAVKNAKGQWRYQDVEFTAEVISRSTGMNDYGPKKDAYAEAGVPLYLVVDPYQGRCHVYTDPKNGEYRSESKADFGEEIDLTHTVIGVTLDTSDFHREGR